MNSVGNHTNENNRDTWEHLVSIVQKETKRRIGLDDHKIELRILVSLVKRFA